MSADFKDTITRNEKESNHQWLLLFLIYEKKDPLFTFPKNHTSSKAASITFIIIARLLALLSLLFTQIHWAG